MQRNVELLETLLELQTLDRVARMGYALRGVAEPESVTEHSWHVAFLVWALADGAGVDRARALELALLHDLAEVRVGDLPRTAARYLPAGAKTTAEAAAIDELLSPLGSRAAELYTEYAAAETPEAKLVKACDKLQLMLKVSLYESWGNLGLSEFWENPGNFPAPGIAVVDRLIEELRSRRRR